MKIGKVKDKLIGAEKGKDRRNRLLILSAAGLVVVIVLLAGVLKASGPSSDVMAAAATHQPLVGMVVERGALKAAYTVSYNAPRMRRGGSQTILELAPEGEVVQPGDLVVRFDSAALEEQIRRQENELEEAEMDLSRTIAQQESQMASLQAEHEMAQHDHEQAELRQRALTFESEIRQRQEEYAFLKSELRLERAWEAIDTQQRVNEASLARQRMQVDRQRRELEEARAELDLSNLYAEQPGLVIYGKTFSQGTEAKINVGDSPWSGQEVVSIPDLSTMVVEVGISELDIGRVAVGQRALVHVDAYPDTVYAATLNELSPLAHRQGLSQIKVFDATVSIEGTDLTLRPGMTATVSIITDYVPRALVVPHEAVFRREGKTIVFTLEGGIEEREVTLGPSDGSYVEIISGLDAGTLVALRDPYMKLDQLETAGAEALLQSRSTDSGGAAGIMEFIMSRGGGGGPGGGRGMSMRIFR